MNLTQAPDALRLTAILLGVGQVLAATEGLYLQHQRLPDAWLPLRLLSVGRGRSGDSLVTRRLSWRVMISVHGVRLLAALGVLAVRPGSWPFASLCLLLVAACLIDSARLPLGGEGADQMSLLIALALLVGGGPWATERLGWIALAFVAGQAVLSYTASGWAKIFSPVWRSGAAVPGILSTYEYGFPRVGAWLFERPLISRAITWPVLILESSFALALVSPRLAVAYMIFGFGFHLTNAFVMGLNAFTPSFVATYPAVLWLATQI